MAPDSAVDQASLPLDALRRIDEISARFEAAWTAGETPLIEDYLAGVEEPMRRALFRELLLSEQELRNKRSAPQDEGAYQARFPHYDDVIRTVLGKPDSGGPGSDSPAETIKGALPHALVCDVEEAARAAGYDILRELGRGGMGVVYLARHAQLERLVALKVIRGGAQANAEQRARFRTEATAVARLQHPNIVQVYEVAERGGVLFLALEYVEGGTLAAQLAGKPQRPVEAARALELLARAVHAAHTRGIVHRDLKPANVLLAVGQASSPVSDAEDRRGRLSYEAEDRRGRLSYVPKITDFGLAKYLTTDPDGPVPGWQTQSGAIVGTPAYMAPEQARGLGAVGTATDVYALGAILYEMLTGRPPFQAATVLDTLQLVCDQEPVPPRRVQPGVPRDLDTICLTCLQKDPAKRYVSAEVLGNDLRRFLEDRPILARPVSLFGRGWRWARRNPGLAVLLALSAFLLLTVAVGSSVAALLLRSKSNSVLAEQKRRRETVVDALLNVNPAGVPVLLHEMNDNRPAFAPLVRRRMDDDSLTADQRLRLALALTSLGEPRTDDLLRAVPAAPAGECANLAAAFATLSDGVALLRQAFDAAQGSEDRFRLAVLLLDLGDALAARQLLAFKAKPRSRATFVQEFRGWHGDLAALPGLLRKQDDSALRSGLCASLGRLDPGLLSPPVAAALREELRTLYQAADDAATHSTAGWALRRWREPLPALAASARPDSKQWCLTRQGLTMVRAEPRGVKPFPWALWVADREMSAGLFLQFVNDRKLAASERLVGWKGIDRKVSPTDDCPAHNVNLHDVMLFCNWLSRRDGRKPCYQPVPGKPWMWTCRLGNDGYRLPTNAEWEYAGRAGTTTKYYFGDDVSLLPSYANVLLPHSEPGGSRLPNDWGLFDVLANCWEMCFDGPPAKEEFVSSTGLTMRGGTYGTGSYVVDFDFAGPMPPADRSTQHGFRVVCREGAPGPVGWADVGVEMIGRLLERDPANRRLRKQRATLLLDLGRGREAADDLTADLAPGPRDLIGHLSAAKIYIQLGRWDRARDHQRRALELIPYDHGAAFHLAPLLVAAGDVAGYREHRQQMLKRWASTMDCSQAERTAKVCCLLEMPREQAEAALALAVRGSRLAEKRKTDPEFHGWSLLAEALASYRCGKYDDAVKRARASLDDRATVTDARVVAHLVRAMALHKLERFEEAGEALAEARRIDLPKEGTLDFYSRWNDQLVCRFLRREAEALLGAKK